MNTESGFYGWVVFGVEGNTLFVPAAAQHIKDALCTDVGREIGIFAVPVYTSPGVLAEVADERLRQEAKWGQQNHPSLPPEAQSQGPNWLSGELGVHSEGLAKALCDVAFREGRGSYAHIAAEEFSEAIFAETEGDRRAELIQVAAVAVAWVECIDRRTAGQ